MNIPLVVLFSILIYFVLCVNKVNVILVQTILFITVQEKTSCRPSKRDIKETQLLNKSYTWPLHIISYSLWQWHQIVVLSAWFPLIYKKIHQSRSMFDECQSYRTHAIEAKVQTKQTIFYELRNLIGSPYHWTFLLKNEGVSNTYILGYIQQHCIVFKTLESCILCDSHFQ